MLRSAFFSCDTAVTLQRQTSLTGLSAAVGGSAGAVAARVCACVCCVFVCRHAVCTCALCLFVHTLVIWEHWRFTGLQTELMKTGVTQRAERRGGRGQDEEEGDKKQEKPGGKEGQ